LLREPSLCQNLTVGESSLCQNSTIGGQFVIRFAILLQ
jgi:hypothetical protein